ncbi:type II CRISPR-associated endonuclease Cas1 [Geminicoccaceae bacterium 1502E]|nr:type II CRISPR-associated endonuclease Cas1 [Geminicoccaceae bacterium 1502E]
MTGSPLGRVVEIAEEGRHLAKERGFLAISAQGETVARLPLDDLAAVIATARGATLTSQLVAALAERNVPLVLCGSKFAPVAILWPVEGHHAQQRRMEAQLSCGRPLAKRLWAQVVAAKVRRQGWTLEALGQPAGAFEQLARKVRSGDPANIEAQAARRYWPLLLGREFRRDTQGDGANILLNYGYAVLRSATARAVAASGLHPGLGIFHRHPNNPMPLVDDLMEPYRPVVDREVRLLGAEGLTELSPEAKRRLAILLWSDQPMEAGTSPLSTCLVRTAQSLAESFASGKAALEFPLRPPDAPPCPTPLP